MNQSEEQFKNEEQFLELLAKFAPHLWKIHDTLKQTKVNPMVIPYVIEAVHEVAYVHGHGDVTIYISDKKITNIEPKPRMKLGIEAIVEEIIVNQG